jgi:hypothetical protein
LNRDPGQLDLLEPARDERWQKALAAADHVRDKFGESAIGLARGMKGGFRERVHENPAALPGKRQQPKLGAKKKTENETSSEGQTDD